MRIKKVIVLLQECYSHYKSYKVMKKIKMNSKSRAYHFAESMIEVFGKEDKEY